MYVYTCEHCGASLDPGEHCDCVTNPRKPDVPPKEPVKIIPLPTGGYQIRVWGDCFKYFASSLPFAESMKKTLLLQFEKEKKE